MKIDRLPDPPKSQYFRIPKPIASFKILIPTVSRTSEREKKFTVALLK